MEIKPTPLVGGLFILIGIGTLGYGVHKVTEYDRKSSSEKDEEDRKTVEGIQKFEQKVFKPIADYNLNNLQSQFILEGEDN